MTPERDRPDLEHTREALRRHDERVEEESELEEEEEKEEQEDSEDSDGEPRSADSEG
jgi:hypothetical protein